MRILFSFSHLFVIFLSVFVFFVQGGEFAFHLSDRLMDEGDSILNAWILAWDAHALFNPELSVWDAPIFYPVKNTLAFSENLLGNLWITLPVQWLTGNHVLAANCLALVSFVLGSYFVFLLVKDLTGNYWASLFAGLIFSFNPYRWTHLAHLQLMPFFWAPLALLFANRFLKNRNYSDFWKTLFFTLMQYYASVYLGTMLLTTLFIVFFVFLFLELNNQEKIKFLKDPKFLKNCFFGIIAGVVVLLPIGIPYLKVAKEWFFFRTLQENILYSAEPLSIFFPSGIYANYSWLREILYTSFHADKNEPAVFIGFTPLIFALVALIFRKKEILKFQNRLILRYVLVSGILFLIMMGPVLFVFGKDTGLPMPFLLVHKLIPGGSAMRVPSRFVLPMLLTVSILCGFGFCVLKSFLARRLLFIKYLAIIGLAAVLIFEYKILNFRGVNFKPQKEFPPVYEYLSKSSYSSPTLEMPFHSWAKFKYFHYQTKHWRPSILGFSGWEPPPFEYLNNRIQACPSESCARLLQIAPFDSLIVHLDLVPWYKRGKFETWDLKPYGFTKLIKIENDLIWERNKEKPVLLNHKWKVDNVYVEFDDHGIIAILILKLKDKGGWRNFSKNSQIQFTIETSDEKTFKTKKKILWPYYFLPSNGNRKIVKIFTRLGKTSNKISSLKIQNEYIQDEEIDFKNLIFLKDERTSKTHLNDLKGEWGSVSGIKNYSKFKQGEMIKFQGIIENTGNSIWLDQNLNFKLYDSDHGSVYTSIQILEKGNNGPCHFKDKILKEYRTPIKNIIPSNGKMQINLDVIAPFIEGKYALSLRLMVKDENGLKRIKESSEKCFEFTVEKSKGSMSFGNLARFFGSAKTDEDKAGLEDFKRLSREDQEERVLYLADFILKNGGLDATLVNEKNIHLWKKVLEIAEFLKNET